MSACKLLYMYCERAWGKGTQWSFRGVTRWYHKNTIFNLKIQISRDIEVVWANPLSYRNWYSLISNTLVCASNHLRFVRKVTHKEGHLSLSLFHYCLFPSIHPSFKWGLVGLVGLMGTGWVCGVCALNPPPPDIQDLSLFLARKYTYRYPCSLSLTHICFLM